MGIFNFLFKAETFKTWKDVQDGLTCLDTDRYRKQFTFILQTGLANSLSPVELQAIQISLNEAANGNLKAIKNLAEPQDLMVRQRLSNWLDRVYNGNKKIRLPTENTPLSPMLVSAPVQTISSLEKVVEFTTDLTGEHYEPDMIHNAIMIKGETWREIMYLASMYGAWVITDQILYPEEALCIPEMVSALRFSSIAMVHWKRKKLAVLNSNAIRESNAIPFNQSVKAPLNIDEIKKKLLSSGWLISEE
jgi:hypothetical protein